MLALLIFRQERGKVDKIANFLHGSTSYKYIFPIRRGFFLSINGVGYNKSLKSRLINVEFWFCEFKSQYMYLIRVNISLFYKGIKDIYLFTLLKCSP